VKFQLAFFEQAGVEGMRALGQLAELAHREGLLVIFDGKRNDIGNTAEAYAKAYLGGWTPIDPNTAAKLELFGAVTETKLYPWPADALTVSPYMGPDTLEPFLKQARDHATGVFVLVRTSNPGAGKLQDLKLGDSTPAHLVADWVDDWNRKELELRPSKSGYGSAGAVVGATVPKQLVDFRKRLTRSILLVPGYGAQGGSAADVAGAFDEQGLGALVNNSRGILYAYRSNDSSDDWRIAARAAAERMIDELARKTPAGNLRV
jgi:orotidine-5'-phosphate decarboxylase